MYILRFYNVLVVAHDKHFTSEMEKPRILFIINSNHVAQKKT